MNSFAFQLTASIKENPRLRAAAEALQQSGGAVGDAVAEAVRRTEESALYRGGKEAVGLGSSVSSPCYILTTLHLPGDTCKPSSVFSL